MASTRACSWVQERGQQASWDTMLNSLCNGAIEDKFGAAANTLTAHLVARTEPTRNSYRLHSIPARLHSGLVQATNLCG